MIVKRISGVALHLILAILLTLFAIGSAVVLSKNRVMSKVPIEMKIKADYEMQSALVMQFQKIRYNLEVASSSFSIPSHTIAPGLTLCVKVDRVSSNSYNLKAQVNGKGFQRLLSAKVCLETYSKGSSKWKMIYVKQAN